MSPDNSTAPLTRLLLTLLLLLLATCSPAERPPEVGKAYRLAAAGRFAESEDVLETLEKRTDIDQSDIAWMIANIRRHKEKYQDAYRRADELVERLLLARTFPEVHRYLRAEIDKWGIKDRYFSRALEGRLRNLDEIADKLLADRAPAAKETSEGEVSRGSEADLFGAAIQHFLEDVEFAASEGDYREAIERLREQLPLSGAFADRVRDRLWRVEGQARQKVQTIAKEAEEHERNGEIKKALALLELSAKSFPDVGPLSRLRHLREEIATRAKAEAALAALPERTRPGRRTPFAEGRTPVTEKGVREARKQHVAQANEAIGHRDFVAAAKHFRNAASVSRDWWPYLEQELEEQAREAELVGHVLATLGEAIAARPERFERVSIGYGQKATVLSADDKGVRARIRGEIEQVPYTAIPDDALSDLVAVAAETADGLVAAALLAVRASKEKRAEELLRKAFTKEATAKPRIDGILARLREEDPGKGGYVLEAGKFVSSAAIHKREVSRKIEATMRRIIARDDEGDRDQAWEALAKQYEEDVDVLAENLVTKKRQLFDKLSKSPLKSSLKKLKVLRVELDKRRVHAKQLIFDRVKYFYPYRPPQVPAEKAKRYWKVQAEVDRRVSAVRQIWKGKSHVLTLPAAIQTRIALYRWLTGKLASLDRETLDLDSNLELYFAKTRTDIRNFALDSRDRDLLDLGDQIVADNAEVAKRLLAENKITPGEAELIVLTNKYRRMMGHLPLKLDERLVRAAHGHCDEMSRLGYFGHTSPTPGRRTPGERMRREGYNRGGGENLAVNFGAAGALNAWLRSSGHHRNLLSPAHQDIGTGNVGRYWAQNFGAGDGGRRRRRR